MAKITIYQIEEYLKDTNADGVGDTWDIRKVAGTEKSYDSDAATGNDFDVITADALSTSLEVDTAIYEKDNVGMTLYGLPSDYFVNYNDPVNKPFVALIEDAGGSLLFSGIIDHQSIRYNARTKYFSLTVMSWEIFLDEITVPARSIIDTRIHDIIGSDASAGGQVELKRWAGASGEIDTNGQIFAGDVLVFSTRKGEIRSAILSVDAVTTDTIKVTTDVLAGPEGMVQVTDSIACTIPKKLARLDGNGVRWVTVVISNPNLYGQLKEEPNAVLYTYIDTNAPGDDIGAISRPIPCYNQGVPDSWNRRGNRDRRLQGRWSVDRDNENGPAVVLEIPVGPNYSHATEAGTANLWLRSDHFREEGGEIGCKILGREIYGYAPTGNTAPYDVEQVILGLFNVQEFGILRHIVDVISVPTGYSQTLPRVIELPDSPWEALKMIQNTKYTFVSYASALDASGFPSVTVSIIPRTDISEAKRGTVAATSVIEWHEEAADNTPMAVVVRPNVEYGRPEGGRNLAGWYYEGIDTDETDANTRQLKGLPKGSRVLEVQVAEVPTYTGYQWNGDGVGVVNDTRLKEIARAFYGYYKNLKRTATFTLLDRRTDIMGKFVSISEVEGGRTVFVTNVEVDIIGGHTRVEGRIGAYAPVLTSTPTAVITGEKLFVDYNADGAVNVQLSAKNSYDPLGEALTYEWQVGGVVETGQTSAIFEKSMATGTYTITLKVTNKQGNFDSTTLTIRCAERELGTTANPIYEHFSIEKIILGQSSTIKGEVRLYPNVPTDYIEDVRFRFRTGGELSPLDKATGDYTTWYPNSVNGADTDFGIGTDAVGTKYYYGRVPLDAPNSSVIEVYIKFVSTHTDKPAVATYTFAAGDFPETFGNEIWVNPDGNVFVGWVINKFTTQLHYTYVKGAAGSVNAPEDPTTTSATFYSLDTNAAVRRDVSQIPSVTLGVGEEIRVKVRAYNSRYGVYGPIIELQGSRGVKASNIEGQVLASQLIKSAQAYTMTPTDATKKKVFYGTLGAPATLSWNEFKLEFDDGGTFTIRAGSTTALATGTNYIYFDVKDTPDVNGKYGLKIINSGSYDSVNYTSVQKEIADPDHVLVCIARASTDSAFFVDGHGELEMDFARINVLYLNALAAKINDQLTLEAGAVLTNTQNEYKLSDVGLWLADNVAAGKTGLPPQGGRVSWGSGYDLYTQDGVLYFREPNGTTHDLLSGGGSGDASMFVTTKDHGAVADGTTDDTAKVQAAMDAAATAKKVLVISPGVHSISHVIIKQGVKGIIGVGSLKARADVLGVIMSENSTSPSTATKSEFFIRDVEINCNSTAQRGIWLINVQNVEVSGCKIHGYPTKGGIHCYFTCRFVNIHHNRITNLSKTSGIQGIKLYGRQDGDSWDPNHVRYDSTDGYYYTATTTDLTSNVVTTSEYYFRTEDVGARVIIYPSGGGTYHYTISSISTNYTNKATLSPVGGAPSSYSVVKGDSTYIIPGKVKRTTTARPDFIQIHNNYVDGGYYALALGRSAYSSVKGNIFTNNMRNIHAGYSEMNLIEGNILLNAESTAINLSYGARFTTVANNFMYSYVGHSGDNSGIVDYVHNEDNTITGNHIQGNWKYGYYAAMGTQRSRVMDNAFIGMEVGIAVEGDWVAGMSGLPTYSRGGVPSYPSTFRDSSSFTIKGNLISVSGTDFLFTTVTNPWGTTYKNKNHVIDSINDNNWSSYMVYIAENVDGTISGMKLSNFRSDVNKTSSNYSLDRGRAHFTEIVGVDGLDDNVRRNITGSAPNVQNGKIYSLANTAATTLTDFTGGGEGQEIWVRGDNYTTIQHNSNIRTVSGANIATSSDRVYRFVRVDYRWHEV